MAEAALITITDINVYRRVDPKFPADRLATFVNSVQRANLRDLLGDALYYDFMADVRTSGKYKELLDGKSYLYNNQTIQYYGLKPVLCFWVLALLARESDMFQVNYGAVQYVDNPQQQFQAAKEKERIASGYSQEAERYANEVRQFLTNYSTTYPLWESSDDTTSTEFITFRV